MRGGIAWMWLRTSGQALVLSVCAPAGQAELGECGLVGRVSAAQPDVLGRGGRWVGRWAFVGLRPAGQADLRGAQAERARGRGGTAGRGTL